MTVVAERERERKRERERERGGGERRAISWDFNQYHTDEQQMLSRTCAPEPSLSMIDEESDQILNLYSKSCV